MPFAFVVEQRLRELSPDCGGDDGTSVFAYFGVSVESVQGLLFLAVAARHGKDQGLDETIRLEETTVDCFVIQFISSPEIQWHCLPPPALGDEVPRN